MTDPDVAAILVKLARLDALLRDYEDLHAARTQALHSALHEMDDRLNRLESAVRQILGTSPPTRAPKPEVGPRLRLT